MRTQLTRGITAFDTIMKNVSRDGQHLIWTGHVPDRPQVISFSQDGRRLNVPRFLWERENGESTHRLKRTCGVHGCIAPGCHEEIPNSRYFKSHRRADKSPADYVRWNETHSRWYVQRFVAGKMVACRSFSRSDRSAALDYSREVAAKIEKIRTENYDRCSTSDPTSN